MLCRHETPGRSDDRMDLVRSWVCCFSCKAIRSCTFALLFIAFTFLSRPALAQLPDGPGKDLTVQICGNCHEAEKVVGYHQTADEWTATISQMVDQGAQGTESQFTAVLNYLVKNFGPVVPVNVNKATANELVTGLAITAKEADSIVKYRTEKGAFKEIDDLKKVPDLDFKKIEAKKNLVTF